MSRFSYGLIKCLIPGQNRIKTTMILPLKLWHFSIHWAIPYLLQVCFILNIAISLFSSSPHYYPLCHHQVTPILRKKWGYCPGLCHLKISGPCGAAVERWTENREVPGLNLDHCTVIRPTNRVILILIIAVPKSCVTKSVRVCDWGSDTPQNAHVVAH